MITRNKPQNKPRFGSRRGNALIEFALGAMVLTYALTGVFQLGYSMYLYNELVAAVRGGARYASLAKLSNAGDRSVPTAYATAVKNMVVYGTTTAGTQPVVPNLTTANVNVAVTFDSGSVPTDCTISIGTYTIDAVFTTFALTNKPSYTIHYFGHYCSSGTSC